jgi:hypothetical protein
MEIPESKIDLLSINKTNDTFWIYIGNEISLLRNWASKCSTLMWKFRKEQSSSILELYSDINMIASILDEQIGYDYHEEAYLHHNEEKLYNTDVMYQDTISLDYDDAEKYSRTKYVSSFMIRLEKLSHFIEENVVKKIENEENKQILLKVIKKILIKTNKFYNLH